MKTRRHFFFDVSSIFLHADVNQGFVPGFSELINKIGYEHVYILVPQNDSVMQANLIAQLKPLHLDQQIRYVRTQKEIAAYVNHPYTFNRYVFLNQFNVEKRHIRQPAALIQIDKNDDLLPEKEMMTIADFRPLIPLF